MVNTEYVVAILGLVFGYWIVHKLITRNPNQKPGLNNEYPVGTKKELPTPQFLGSPNGASWDIVLDVSSSSKVGDIRRAYKIQMSRYHPDKVAGLGVELRALAERKSKEINGAYRQAMREHGVSEQLW